MKKMFNTRAIVTIIIIFVSYSCFGYNNEKLNQALGVPKLTISEATNAALTTVTLSSNVIADDGATVMTSRLVGQQLTRQYR